MKVMKFESNTKGKLNKILDGSIFESPLTFITELMQNAYRAKAKTLFIDINDDKIIFQDNGCGLKKPESLITFDYSEWKSTQEGFGIGFWSVLAIPGISYVRIKSNKFDINVDVETAKDNLEVLVTESETPIDGFYVELKSDYIFKNATDIIDRIKSDGERMIYNIYLNGTRIPRKDIFEGITGDFKKSYNNRYFEAVLCVAPDAYSNPMLVYELRDVKKLYWFNHITGVVSLKKNVLKLKEPDRKEIVYDDKYNKFRYTMNKCIVDLYKSFLETINDDYFFNEYEDAITNHLDTKDYEKFLLVDEITEKTKTTDKIKVLMNVSNQKIDVENIRTSLNQLAGKNVSWVVSDKKEEETDNVTKLTVENVENIINNIENTSEIVVGNQILKKVEKEELNTDNEENNDINNEEDSEDTNELEEVEETEETEEDNSEEDTDSMEDNNSLDNCIEEEEYEEEVVDEKNYAGSVAIPIVKNPTKGNRKTLKEILKKHKNIMWVELANSDKYYESIALAEYYGITVFKAKNKMFEEFLKEKQVPHIENINSAIIKDYAITELFHKTSKEDAFIKLLEPIRKHYKLQRGVFKIGNISEKITVEFNGNNLKQETKKNSAKKINVYAVTYNGEIIFDRKATNLKKFSIANYTGKTAVGKNELKCLMFNLNTIAHELAHLLYNTTDNTDTHREYERMLESQIIDIYVNL
ncbi:MAG: hypothetical protein K0R54_528 [Clostridiaceae bacterium]|jgi:hypothetical protein|nr:hypothetical protein [Clostridiaceae bacterium]